MELSNGVLIHHPTTRTDPADLVITLSQPQLRSLLAGAGNDGVQFDGDAKLLATIVALTDQADPAFPIVTP
jgi:alkyl sulfatase BDS1-like metallo-beta-lactamase superfamily hydrolase